MGGENKKRGGLRAIFTCRCCIGFGYFVVEEERILVFGFYGSEGKGQSLQGRKVVGPRTNEDFGALARGW